MGDTFRPHFPLDPFAQTESEKWQVDLDALTEGNSNKVVLVIGDAPADDILYSSRLTDSLILVLTHNPPKSVPLSGPTIRILRTQNPWNGDAVAFGSALERAKRVAQLWRNGQQEEDKYVQLCEDGVGGQFTITEPIGSASQTTEVGEGLARPRPRQASSNSRPLSMISFSEKSSSSIASLKKSPAATCRAFDAVIHFIPSDLEEKLMFKRVVLVSTLVQSFLTPSPNAPSAYSYLGKEETGNRRASMFAVFQSTESLPKTLRGSSSPTTPTVSRAQTPLPSPLPSSTSPAHLVHVLPTKKEGKSHLVTTLESFLFSYFCASPLKVASRSPRNSMFLQPSAPNSPLASPVGTPAGSTTSLSKYFSDAVESKTILPYIVSRDTLTSTPSASPFSIGELLLLGALDSPSSTQSLPLGMSMSKSIQKFAVRPKVWIASEEDVKIVGGGSSGDGGSSPPGLTRLPTIKTNESSSSSESSTSSASMPLKVISLGPPPENKATGVKREVSVVSAPESRRNRKESLGVGWRFWRSWRGRS